MGWLRDCLIACVSGLGVEGLAGVGEQVSWTAMCMGALGARTWALDLPVYMLVRGE